MIESNGLYRNSPPIPVLARKFFADIREVTFEMHYPPGHYCNDEAFRCCSDVSNL